MFLIEMLSNSWYDLPVIAHRRLQEQQENPKWKQFNTSL